MANPIILKNIADDDMIGAPGGKRKMSSDLSPEQINVIKKIKESKTQSGKWLMNIY